MTKYYSYDMQMKGEIPEMQYCQKVKFLSYLTKIPKLKKQFFGNIAPPTNHPPNGGTFLPTQIT